ncbi:hypothetical protein GCM10020229_20980 [Kitasatospora albolonga]
MPWAAIRWGAAVDQAVGEADHGEAAGGDGVGEDAGAVDQQVDGLADVLGYELAVLGVAGRAGGEHAGGDALDHVADEARGPGARLDGGAGRGHGAAGVVAEHDHQRGAEHGHAVLDAAQHLGADHLAGPCGPRRGPRGRGRR